MASHVQEFSTYRNAISVASNGFKSKRLIYRAIEDTEEDKKFIHEEIQCDPTNFILSDNRVFRPQLRKTSDDTTKDIVANSLLAVMVCLPPSEDKSASEEKKDREKKDEKDEKKEEPKPIPIGFVILWSSNSNSTAHHRNASLGIDFAKEYQGKGYGSETLDWTLDWAFRFGNLHRVDLCCFGYNEVARKVYERAGFKLEGIMREKTYFDRKYWDEYNYGILESDWMKLRGLEQ